LPRKSDLKGVGGRVLNQKKSLLCVCFLSLSFLLALPVSAQIRVNDGASLNQVSSNGLDPQPVPQGSQGWIAISSTGFNDRNPSDPTFSDSPHNVAIHEDVSGENSTSDVIKQNVADPNSIVSKLPPTLTVSTAALLELHAMRKSAVDLCLQLPTKYRTRLPECAEIFKHEIRLQGLAKERH
jgi:hypothetical protein